MLGMGYIADQIMDRQWPFLLCQVVGYRGQPIDELGIVVGKPVDFVVDEESVIEVYSCNTEKSMANCGAK